MSKVEFTYVKGGKKVLMARRYAETLAKLGHGSFAGGPEYQTRMLKGGKPSIVVEEEPLISDALREFAAEHNVDLDLVVGTGKEGRIKKSDIEAAIKPAAPEEDSSDQDLA